jgi:hypothetical protein
MGGGEVKKGADDSVGHSVLLGWVWMWVDACARPPVCQGDGGQVDASAGEHGRGDHALDERRGGARRRWRPRSSRTVRAVSTALPRSVSMKTPERNARPPGDPAPTQRHAQSAVPHQGTNRADRITYEGANHSDESRLAFTTMSWIVTVGGEADGRDPTATGKDPRACPSKTNARAFLLSPGPSRESQALFRRREHASATGIPASRRGEKSQ